MGNLSKDTMDTSGDEFLNRVPILILAEILSKLDLKNLLNCQLVNRKWNFTIKNFVKIKQLAVSNDDFNNRHHLNLEPIEEQNIFLTENINLFQSEIIKSVCKNLKKLNIFFKMDDDGLIFDPINDLNQFEQLEILDIFILNLNSTAVLKLPNLKKLSIEYIGEKQLVLDLPALENFKIKNFLPERNDSILKQFKFLFLDQITHLSLDRYEHDVLKFENLKNFYCKYLDNRTPLNLLTLLQSLQELHCSEIKIDLAISLLTEKSKLRRDLKLFLCGFEINSLKELNDYKRDDSDICSFYTSFDEDILYMNSNMVALNFKKSTPLLPWIYKLNYNKLIQYAKFEINSNFVQKFINFEKLKANGKVDDVNHFIKFIKLFNDLHGLQLENCSLPSSFYDQLPALIPSLLTLRIDEKIELNLEFLMQFEEIAEISIKSQKIPLDLLIRILEKSNRLCVIMFQLNDSMIEIEPCKFGDCLINCDGEEFFVGDFTQMIKCLREILYEN